jgi:endogenous inhibitor of DNA gyrase (YacG/DUF329 family)
MASADTPAPAAAATPPRRPAPEVDCPACGTKTRFEPANPYRPFCSQRCQARDFGAWASENYRVAADAPPDPDQPPKDSD